MFSYCNVSTCNLSFDSKPQFLIIFSMYLKMNYTFNKLHDVLVLTYHILKYKYIKFFKKFMDYYFQAFLFN